MRKIPLILLLLACCTSDKDKTIQRLYDRLAVQKNQTDSMMELSKSYARKADSMPDGGLMENREAFEAKLEVLGKVDVLNTRVQHSKKIEGEIKDSIMLIK